MGREPGLRLFTSEESWIESSAVEQLENALKLPGMQRAVGLPDLHPGKGAPIGAALLCRGRLYPHLVGNDVGCGIALWQTDLPARKAKRDHWVKRLSALEEPIPHALGAWFEAHGIATPVWESAMGTIGGGNHFAELQRVQEVIDAKRFRELGLDDKMLFLCVHSGSRGLGAEILTRHVEAHGAGGLPDNDELGLAYLERHALALKWAKANRDLIAARFVERIGGTPRAVLDVVHNGVAPVRDEDGPLWVHRKGAAAAEGGPVMIPGSRGAASYLVMPKNASRESAWSLAHGAGRRYGRSGMKERLRGKYTREALRQTALGSVVICTDNELLYEEAPEAYKNIEQVIADLKAAALIEVVARFTPLITYKTSARGED